MRCVAVIDAERPGLDTVIVWADQDRLVAVSYLDGKVTMTRPLAAITLDDAANEIRDSFQINEGQMIRITDWAFTAPATLAQPIAPDRVRW